MSAAPELVARCHCGQATITLPRRPDYINHCNCSLCAKTGWRGIYYAPGEVAIAGQFDGYVRGDLKQTYLRILRCANCGIATHWELLTPPPHERMGVNARLVDPGLLEGVEVREIDGARWDE
ncbi:GFA family protein [Sphingomonas sp.]|uniref:GFA family protein n=1 Tax=Sphingomonas sp. TaxID=28214 RepID=UPI00286DEC64|nr:GFA family protein [Sphingomonas sp.]